MPEPGGHVLNHEQKHSHVSSSSEQSWALRALLPPPSLIANQRLSRFPARAGKRHDRGPPVIQHSASDTNKPVVALKPSFMSWQEPIHSWSEWWRRTVPTGIVVITCGPGRSSCLSKTQWIKHAMSADGNEETGKHRIEKSKKMNVTGHGTSNSLKCLPSENFTSSFWLKATQRSGKTRKAERSYEQNP